MAKFEGVPFLEVLEKKIVGESVTFTRTHENRQSYYFVINRLKYDYDYGFGGELEVSVLHCFH